MMCRKLEMLPIECIVRGYITGSGWESYKKTGKVCGIELPEGLKNPTNCRNRFTPRLPKQRSVITMRIFLLNRA